MYDGRGRIREDDEKALALGKPDQATNHALHLDRGKNVDGRSGARWTLHADRALDNLKGGKDNDAGRHHRKELG